MRYSALGGGKRLRPMLAYATAITLGKPLECADVPACALELIHVYSLIHDDLPAMDDDDLRRGKPTCHKAFNEALAILAGDGLQALAFQLLASSTQLSVNDNTRIKMITALSMASGAAGMVAGQAIDLDSVGKKLTISELENMHLHKTGALISASVKLGALAAGNATDQQFLALDEYARCIGLAFQVQDDILDIESSTETLGKKQGADAARNKPTYPALLGMDNAKQKLNDLIEKAINALTIFDDASLLKALADYIRKRAY
jgi:geranylgeranyl pyrophosphate synthase